MTRWNKSATGIDWCKRADGKLYVIKGGILAWTYKGTRYPSLADAKRAAENDINYIIGLPLGDHELPEPPDNLRF